MKTTTIERCRLCDSARLEAVFDYGVQALSTRFPGPDEPDAERVPLALALCRECELVQLTHDYDPDDLYRRGYGYRSGVNRTMREHLAGIVAEARSLVALESGDTVLDIASNDGTLLHAYPAKAFHRVGIDPTIAQYGDRYDPDVRTAAEFFSAELFRAISPTPKARIVTSIAVLYDVPDPHGFVAGVAEVLARDGVWVLEQSYLPLLVRDLAFDSICHEHLCYFGLAQLQRLAEAHDLRLFRARTNAMNGGSVRAFLCHRNAPFPDDAEGLDVLARTETAARLDAPATFRAFHARVVDLGERLRDLLARERASGRRIHVYGASTKGNVLLQLFGIDRRLIDVAAERNEWKWGHRTPGTGIPIVSEAESRAARPDFYLVLPYHFRDEFVAREAEFLARGGRLIFPLPQLEVVPPLEDGPAAAATGSF